MSNKEEILLWADGLAAYKRGDFANALDAFQQIGDYSRIHFNSGIIYTRLEDHVSASVCYARALNADPYLAVAYFQRAYCYFMQEEFDRAYDEYSAALGLLRENDYIDYSQLGLKYRLYRCEIHFNRAMCSHSFNDTPSCTTDISYAQRSARTDEQRAIIDRAARVGVEAVTLFTVPVDAVFEVAESKIKNAGQRTFLKDAKVVVDAAGGGDGWAGFDGAVMLDPMVGAGGTGLERGKTLVRRAGSDGALDRNPDAMDVVTARRTRTPPPNFEPGPPSTISSSLSRNPYQQSNAPYQQSNTQPLSRTATTLRQRNSSLPTQRLLRAATDSNRQPPFNQDYLPRSYSDSSTLSRTRQNPYPSPSTSPNTLYPTDSASISRGSGSISSSASSTLKNKYKIKLHTLAPLTPRTVLLLVPFESLSCGYIMNKAREKFGIRGKVLVSFRDRESEEGEGFISILDDDDLGVAVEVMEGRCELFVGEGREREFEEY